jgi:hypothetical protein
MKLTFSDILSRRSIILDVDIDIVIFDPEQWAQCHQKFFLSLAEND